MGRRRVPKLKSALPPKHAAFAIGALAALCQLFLPTLEEIDEVATVETFTHSIFPNLLTPTAIGWIRIVFAGIIFATEFVHIKNGSAGIRPTYLPNSKLTTTELDWTGRNRFKVLGFFTQWSWLLLGYSFLASGTIALLASYLDRNDTMEHSKSMLLRSALLTFEVSAPTSFLVAAAVTYALWPVALKAKGPAGTVGFKRVTSLMQHNANVLFVLCEVCLLGGLPVKMSHAAVGQIYGMIYIVFSWFMMTRWKPSHGPVALYFFVDTTLGAKTTIMLMVLAFVLLLSHLFFASFEDALMLYFDGGIIARVVSMILALGVLCRLRD